MKQFIKAVFFNFLKRAEETSEGRVRREHDAFRIFSTNSISTTGKQRGTRWQQAAEGDGRTLTEKCKHQDAVPDKAPVK